MTPIPWLALGALLRMLTTVESGLSRAFCVADDYRPTPKRRMVLVRQPSLTLATLAMAVTAACGIGPGVESDAINAEVATVPMEIEAGKYFGLAWPREDLIVTSRSFSPPLREETVAVRPDGSDFRVVPIAPVEGCRSTHYEFPSTVVGGRVAMTRVCDAQQGVTPVADYAVVIVDPDTGGTMLQSAIGPNFNPAGSSWNPDLSRGVAAQSSRICASIAWLTKDGVEDMDLRLGSGDQSWRVDEESRSADCVGGRTDWPAWSPDGRLIAFMASPESVGVRGQRRLYQPWNLYVMSADATKPTTIVEDIESARGTSWSPDSRHIAYIEAGSGVFVVGAAGGTPRRVSSLQARWLAWSPDGTRLAMLAVAQDSAEESWGQLHVLDLPRSG